jgi:hypothetical protein
MITKTIAEVRAEWGGLLEQVTASAEPAHHLEIRRSRGRPKDREQAAVPVAVVVSIGWYEALPEGCRPSGSQVQSMQSSQARAKLAGMVEAALRGVHTKIEPYGRPPVAVVVPPDWYAEAGRGDDGE